MPRPTPPISPLTSNLVYLTYVILSTLLKCFYIFVSSNSSKLISYYSNLEFSNRVQLTDRVIFTSSELYARSEMVKLNELISRAEIRVLYNLFVNLINYCDFYANVRSRVQQCHVDVRRVQHCQFDVSRVQLTFGRSYMCVCRIRVVVKVRDSYKLYFDPLVSSTDFEQVFNFDTSQFKLIDCNYFIVVNNLISIVFIFNCRLFRQLHSIRMASGKCVHDSDGKVWMTDAIVAMRGALKCCSVSHYNVRSIVAERHLSGPAGHFGFPIVLSKTICLPVISYVYYNFIIIKNVIPKIDLKFLHTSVIVMPFFLIFYPLSGFYISFSLDNSYECHSLRNERIALL
nr:uncharacterized protein LOC110383446 isoform X1 [Helicoverpa armigera]XP_049707361.1 uncharacterized protein LOC110383446 isoform X1 [Helicoverpa armigera]XP_049707362.1 uncharacterized protein LOC110383446 isoform X1 [Helicoverpa armigera]XP_049707363.1 uncharacterized protein LOC110383446 isoform X1 [Helicoverpa armigera]XP_049707364.1 uncharacterized protein LOC110383446 isoform X1 [Helicoverpa armigera]XP_049707365.1 uncharacterized protein LOC110383446 isoform X1 [Helicoverpa armigera]